MILYIALFCNEWDFYTNVNTWVCAERLVHSVYEALSVSRHHISIKNGRDSPLLLSNDPTYRARRHKLKQIQHMLKQHCWSVVTEKQTEKKLR